MPERQGLLPFEIDSAPKDGVTAHAGLPLIVETLRALYPRRAWRSLATALGYRKRRTVRRHLESVVSLIVAGGECVDDLERLRSEDGLERLLGFRLSSPTQAKDFLYRFHQGEDGSALDPQDDARLSEVGHAQIRPEGPGLVALFGMVREVVRRAATRGTGTRATLDVDATLVEAHKSGALRTYEGFRGYRPQMAWWAEKRLWVCDEFAGPSVGRPFGGAPAPVPSAPASGLVQNLLRLIANAALPSEIATMRPKGLRFRLFGLAGVVVRHARRLVHRLAATAGEIAMYLTARRTILSWSRAGPDPS